MGQIGVALNAMLLGSDALSRAVLALGAVRRNPVNFVQDCIVNIAAKCAFYGLKLGFMAIAGKLDAIGKAGAGIVYKPHGTFTITATDEIGNNHFAIGVNGRPCPCVTHTIGADLAWATFFCLA